MSFSCGLAHMVFMKHVNDQTSDRDLETASDAFPNENPCSCERESFINGDRSDNKQVSIYKGELY